mmetsp:Transcript_550/g.1716  ORF Transcript_550/g.1716 Transcript_550/m.1716 type:complete len:116 (+) Transcript_550:80-427(+)
MGTDLLCMLEGDLLPPASGAGRGGAAPWPVVADGATEATAEAERGPGEAAPLSQLPTLTVLGELRSVVLCRRGGRAPGAPVRGLSCALLLDGGAASSPGGTGRPVAGCGAKPRRP